MIIETVYKGYRFRSRLEARWAVFFDAAGIQWRYEPEGFERKNGPYMEGKTVRYLPDFYLPETGTWVEVKPNDVALRTDCLKLNNMLDFGSPLPHVHNSFGTTHGLLLLGDIPDPNGTYIHPLVQHDKGLWRRWIMFDGMTPWGFRLLKTHLDDSLDTSEAGWVCTPIKVQVPWKFPLISTAYTAARSARFEFGETPG